MLGLISLYLKVIDNIPHQLINFLKTINPFIIVISLNNDDCIKEKRTLLRTLVTIRRIAEKTYSKINPQYKHIIRTRNSVKDLQERIGELESKISNIEASVLYNSSEKLYLTDEITTYRYLYLQRFIKGGERILDLEGKFGAGLRLLAKFTMIDGGDCYNSIGYYSRMAKMLYGEEIDSINYRQGTVFDVKEKYDIVTCFNEAKNEAIDEEYLHQIYDILETDGLFAISLDQYNSENVLEMLKEKGFVFEQKRYQNNVCPELVSEKELKSVTIAYMRKKS